MGGWDGPGGYARWEGKLRRAMRHGGALLEGKRGRNAAYQRRPWGVLRPLSHSTHADVNVVSGGWEGLGGGWRWRGKCRRAIRHGVCRCRKRHKPPWQRPIEACVTLAEPFGILSHGALHAGVEVVCERGRVRLVGARWEVKRRRAMRHGGHC